MPEKTIDIHNRWLKVALKEHLSGDITVERLAALKRLDRSEYRAEA